MFRRLLFFAIGAAAVCGGFYATHELPKARARYAVEVTLEAGNQRVTGRTVMEGHWWINYGLGRSDLYADVYGEAIPLTFAGLGTVFVLRRSTMQEAGRGSGGWLSKCISEGTTGSLLEAIMTAPPCEIDEYRPLLAINRGTEARPRMETLYYSDQGGPISMVRFAVERTDEPVTRGLTASYPWLKSVPTFMTPGGGTMVWGGLIYFEDFVR